MAGRTTRSRRPHLSEQAENQSRAKWTASLTKTLADLMVNQIHRGNTSNKSFSKKGWKFICDDFRIQTGFWWDNEQLKSRYVALRKQYINVRLLVDHPDFKLDEATGSVTATDEAWDRYIEEHADAETVRSMGCPIYNQLQTIFAEPRMYEKQNGSTTKDSEDISSCSLHPTVKLEEEVLQPSESEKYVDHLSSRKRGRKGIEDAIAGGILEMAAATKLRAEAINKYNTRFPISDCVGALDELQSVNDQVYFAALDLFSNRNARETFLTLKVDKRLLWLQRKCFDRCSSFN